MLFDMSQQTVGVGHDHERDSEQHCQWCGQPFTQDETPVQIEQPEAAGERMEWTLHDECTTLWTDVVNSFLDVSETNTRVTVAEQSVTTQILPSDTKMY